MLKNLHVGGVKSWKKRRGNVVASGTDAKPAEQKGDFKIFALNNILQLYVLQVSFCRVQYTRMNVRIYGTQNISTQ